MGGTSSSILVNSIHMFETWHMSTLELVLHTLRLPLGHLCTIRNVLQISNGAFMHQMTTPHLFLPRSGFPGLVLVSTNELGMSRATILENGVVIRFESFELQPFKFDQLFRGVFKRSSNCNTYRNEDFEDIFSYSGNSL